MLFLFGRIWAQTTTGYPWTPNPNAFTSSPEDAWSLSSSEIRRWFAQMTLTVPKGLEGLELAIWSGLTGIGVLAVWVLLAQGPRKALGQFFDMPGHARLLSQSLMRLRLAARLVGVLFGLAVMTWTWTEFTAYLEVRPRGAESASRLDDVKQMLKHGGDQDLPWEWGALSGVTPAQDIAALGDWILLALLAGIVAFQQAAEQSTGQRSQPGRPSYLASTLAWAAVWLHALSRIVMILTGRNGMPIPSCFPGAFLALPLLALAADGLILAWVAVELRSARPERLSSDPLDGPGAIRLFGAAMLAAFLLFPARVLLHGVWLLQTAPGALISDGELLRWAVLIQGLALPFFGIVGALAWSRGQTFRLPLTYFKYLRANGGRVLAITITTCLCCAGASWLSHSLMLSLPPRSWTLAAADCYAHYASLFFAAIACSAFVELGRASLPEARLAPEGTMVSRRPPPSHSLTRSRAASTASANLLDEQAIRFLDEAGPIASSERIAESPASGENLKI